MKKYYLICTKHPNLHFDDGDEMLKHVRDEHADEVEEYLKDMRKEAEEAIAWRVSDLKMVMQEEKVESIDLDKVVIEIKLGKQSTLEVIK